MIAFLHDLAHTTHWPVSTRGRRSLFSASPRLDWPSACVWDFQPRQFLRSLSQALDRGNETLSRAGRSGLEGSNIIHRRVAIAPSSHGDVSTLYRRSSLRRSKGGEFARALSSLRAALVYALVPAFILPKQLYAQQVIHGPYVKGLCFVLLVVVLTLGIRSNAAAQDLIAQFANDCPEGQYLNLLNQVCQPLLRPGLGFNRTEFLDDFVPYSNNVHNVDDCTKSQLNAKLDLVESAGGGIVVVPECTIQITGKVWLPSNVILRGSGPNSRLVAVSGFDTHMLEAKYVKNVVVQDLSLIGARASGTGFLIWRSQNVLAERLNIDSFGKSGIPFRFSHGITIRYSTSSNTKKYHGISSKDCGPSDPNIPDIDECIAKAGDLGPYGTVFTHNFSVYSNYALNNGSTGGNGLNFHAEQGEVAGNYSSGNTSAAKFPDAMSVLIHHNLFEGGLTRGVRLYSAYMIDERRVRDVVFYKNVFRVTADYTLGSWDNLSVYMIDNAFGAEDVRIIRNRGDTLFVCPETQETDGTVSYAYSSPPPAPSSFCTGLGFLTLYDDA